METREIPLTRGRVAIVDAADYKWLNQRKWYAARSRDSYYASTKINEKQVLMHRLIMGVSDPRILVDHADMDTLNNRRGNLRLATNSQNRCNTGPFKNNKSGIKGVYQKKCGRWIAKININHKLFWLGTFESKEDAAAAYNQAAATMHGEFARGSEHIAHGDAMDARRIRISSTGFRGVDKVGRHYVARLYKAGQHHRIGPFMCAEDAARAYNKKALELYGDKAKINGVDL